MPRLKVTATVTATVTEEWVVDITDEQYAALLADQATAETDQHGVVHTDDALDAELIEMGAYVNVENVRVENETDREVTGFELVADDFTNAVASAGI